MRFSLLFAFCCAMFRRALSFSLQNRNLSKSPIRKDSVVRLFGSIEHNDPFRMGDKVQVEVLSFGPLGATVGVVSRSHDENDLIPETEPPLAMGLIIQKEIHYFRQSRDNVDVVLGEILPGYVERHREDIDKVDISLRGVGGKQKALDTADLLLKRLKEQGGSLPVGDKSTPSEVNELCPGTSKSAFKRAISQLYKKGHIDKPQPHSITLVAEDEKKEQSPS